jgi:hypothetical protein
MLHMHVSEQAYLASPLPTRLTTPLLLTMRVLRGRIGAASYMAACMQRSGRRVRKRPPIGSKGFGRSRGAVHLLASTE